jgi:fructose-1,6-bisphosphatase
MRFIITMKIITMKIINITHSAYALTDTMYLDGIKSIAKVYIFYGADTVLVYAFNRKYNANY